MKDKIFSDKNVIRQLVDQLTDPQIALRKQAAARLKAYPDRPLIIESYLDFLPEVPPNLALILLAKIEREGRGQKNIAPRLLPLICSTDYRLRARTFITLARIADASVGSELIRFIAGWPGEEWQLRALDCFYHFRDRSWIHLLAGFLTGRENPLLVRGTLWLIGFLGGSEAIEVIGEFAASAQGRLVKDEVVIESLRMAVDSCPQGEAFLADLRKRSPRVARALRYILLPDGEEPRFSVYPYPDYLLDQAKAQGLSGDAFRRLSFWDRD